VNCKIRLEGRGRKRGLGGGGEERKEGKGEIGQGERMDKEIEGNSTCCDNVFSLCFFFYLGGGS
jgi:hypothetical protein